tara:strand:- start:83 stop:553 length:471 start_codon:yes stop_codon:yes gene_type:complete
MPLLNVVKSPLLPPGGERREKPLPSPEYSPKSQTPEMPPLHEAIRRGNVKKVTELLKNPHVRENINKKNIYGNTPLIEAVSKGYNDKYVKIVKLLLEHGAKFTIKESDLILGKGRDALEISEEMKEQSEAPEVQDSTKAAVNEINKLLIQAKRSYY